MKDLLDNERPSVYHRGAQDGLIFGAYLSVMFLASVMSNKMPFVGLAGTLMALFVPGMIYIFLSRSMRMDGGRSTFSALWMHGIVTFICGSAVMALVMYIFLRFVKPDFIISQMYLIIDTYNSIDSPTAHDMARSLQQLIDHKMVPSPISFAVTMLWLGAFTGSILSMVVALIIRYIIYGKKKS